MPASSKPRKKYRPGAAVAKAQMARIARLPLDKRSDSLYFRMHGAVSSIVGGKGTQADWDDVAAALNVAMVLSEVVYDSEYRSDIFAASIAHARCGSRKLDTGRFGYSGEELKAINLALDVHEAQLANITNAELDRAIAEVKRRQRAQPTITPKNFEERLRTYAAEADNAQRNSRAA